MSRNHCITSHTRYSSRRASAVGKLRLEA
jgi:hypothetical protein